MIKPVIISTLAMVAPISLLADKDSSQSIDKDINASAPIIAGGGGVTSTISTTQINHSKIASSEAAPFKIAYNASTASNHSATKRTNSDKSTENHEAKLYLAELDSDTAKRTDLDSRASDSSVADSSTTASAASDSAASSDTQNIAESKELSKITAYGSKQTSSTTRYDSSAGVVDRQLLESAPTGNGDISSALRVLPNVATKNASSSSQTPGEISPANISISGGVPYQNSFQLDGFEMNNDLDPAGSSSNTQPRQRGGLSQGLNVDVGLLDSIVVLDSNVSAAYGRFSGGVVEANVRKPRSDGWHGNFSWQYTASQWTKYYGLENSALGDLVNSSNENYQPNFYKNLFRANVEGYITKNLGVIASFSTTRAVIPLQSYNNGTSQEKQDQKRTSDNYYIKINYNPTENLTLEYNFAYMPQDNTYFTPNFKNSRYTMRGGGIQTGLKALYQTKIGLSTTTLSYSRLENSRRSDANYYTMINGSEGQFGSVDQIQDNVTLKSDFLASPIVTGILAQSLRGGLELIYQGATRDRIEDSHMYIYGGGPVTGTGWNGQADSFGFISANAERYYNTMGIIKAGKTSFNTFTYGIYLEDDATIDMKGAGSINARFGLRLDGDNYLSKHKVAPRFSLSYVAPWEEAYKTQFTFGANRYYARNLLAYRFYADAINSRVAYCRSGVNEAWQEYNGGNNTCGTFTGNLSNGVVQGSNKKLQDLDVPYDDELMGSWTQNLALFTLNFKYIHRDGKDQVTTKTQQSANLYYWDNSGRTKSDIFTLMISNAKPIETFGVSHHYLFALDWTNTTRNYNTHNADYDLDDAILYNGVSTTYANMPAQKYNQPLTLRLNTTHAFNIWRTKWIWNNFFKYRGTYERIVLDSLANSSNGNMNSFSDAKLGNTFSWDMRVGFEVNVWRGNTLYVNLDIYNLLNSKHLTTLSGEDGVLLYGVPSNAAVLAYGLGRQIWIQTGYKF